MGWSNLLPAIVLLLAARSYGYTANKCYCWNDLTQDDTLMEYFHNLTDVPATPDYSYTGVKFSTFNVSQPCVCTDVTRTQLKVTLLEAFAYQSAMANDSESLKIVQNQLKDVLTPLDVNKTITSITATLIGAAIPSVTYWNFEVDTKGYNVIANLSVAEMFWTNTSLLNNGSYFSPTLGVFNSSFQFVVLQCKGDPPLPSAHGSRNWTSLRFAGVMAYYSCDQGYFISDPKLAYVQCSNDYINWTTPQINLTCAPGCQSDPPMQPWFSIRRWNSTQRKIGDTANYTCMSGYRSVDGTNGTSTCLSTTQNWTAVQTNFKCRQIFCPMDIPQVPSFTKSNWDGQTVIIGTQITYTCIDGFSQTVQGTIMSTCQETGNWTKLPYGFSCVNVQTAIRLGIYYPGSNFAYDYYDDGIYKNKVVSTPSYAALFAYVTIPTVIAITLVLVFIMCGTRTNSCIYWLCTGNTKKTAYVKA